jgi:hypothetical protein
MKRNRLAFLVSLVAVVGCSAPTPSDEPISSSQAKLVVPIDARRSLAVTDVAIVSAFPLSDVLDRLTTPPMTSLELFQRWMASYGTCSEVVDGVEVPNSFNGFPFTCRALDAADQNPFDSTTRDSYMTIGLFNRFDLAPPDGGNCGEYRMVFARRSGETAAGRSRKFLIFESVLPNPNPAEGLRGCAPVARFWAGLSAVDSIAERTNRLRAFYFDGLPGFEPVVHATHYGDLPPGSDGRTNGGQIRVNSFLQFPDWSLREFKLKTVCDPTCRRLIAAEPTADNPHFSLVREPGESGAHPLASAFQTGPLMNGLSLQGDALLDGDPVTFSFRTPRQFNAGESIMFEPIGGPPIPTPSVIDQTSSALRLRVQQKLIDVQANITADDAVARLNALTCQGCHRTANDTTVSMTGLRIWPNSFGFTHTSEQSEVSPEGGRRFIISTALIAFLAQRQAALEAYLNGLESSVTAQLGNLSRWNAGYCFDVIVTNNGSASTASWQVSLDTGAATIYTTWGSRLSGTQPRYALASETWTAVVPPNGSTHAGFCATTQTPSVDPTVVGVSWN